MASSDLITRAKEDFIDDDFERAVNLYSQAIIVNPHNSNLFSEHAQAYIKLHNYKEAVSDANKAITFDPSIPKAYMRRGIACFNLEKYRTAKKTFEAGAYLAPDDARFSEWIKKCDECIAEENGTEFEQINNISSEVATKPKYRHEYYQTRQEVVVTIFAGGLFKKVSVNFDEQILSVTVYEPGDEPFIFQPRLFGNPCKL